MKIIAFIEAHQHATIRKILEHCGLWQDPPPRAPPPRLPQNQADLWDSRRTAEVDPDFLEPACRQAGTLDAGKWSRWTCPSSQAEQPRKP
jgi:hypothetical protein